MLNQTLSWFTQCDIQFTNKQRRKKKKPQHTRNHNENLVHIENVHVKLMPKIKSNQFKSSDFFTFVYFGCLLRLLQRQSIVFSRENSYRENVHVFVFCRFRGFAMKNGRFCWTAGLSWKMNYIQINCKISHSSDLYSNVTPAFFYDNILNMKRASETSCSGEQNPCSHSYSVHLISIVNSPVLPCFNCCELVFSIPKNNVK